MAQDPSYMSTGAAPTSDERTMAMLAHLGGILFGFIPALVIYLIKGNESRFVKEESAEALNFQITVAIAYVAAGILIIALIGLLLLPIVWIGSVVLAIVGGLQANKGQSYRYPVNLRFVKA